MNDGDIVLAGCFFTILIIGGVAGLLWGYYAFDEQFKKGYVQALSDIESKRPPKYKLVKQENGETMWIKNEEKGK